MAWQKKPGPRDPMRWLIERIPAFNDQAVATHLAALVADGWFVHSIAPESAQVIFIASCRRDKAAVKKKGKEKPAKAADE